MKNFYQLPKFIQWIIAIFIIVFGFGAIIPLMRNWYSLFLLPLLAPLFNLISVPFLRLIGYYKYLNPYVISTVQTDKMYDLHNVFTFDYIVNFKWSDRGKYAQRILIGHYLKALLKIIERIELKQLPSSVKIVGHSFFLMKKLRISWALLSVMHLVPGYSIP